MLLHWLWYRFFLPESDVDQRKSQLERQTQPQRFNPFQPQFPQFGMFLQFYFKLNHYWHHTRPQKSMLQTLT